AVIGSVDQELGNGEPVAVGEGVDHAPEFGPLPSLRPLHQAAVDVVVDLLAVLAPDIELIRTLRAHVEHDDDHGGDGNHPVVHRAGQPSGPAALGTAGHDEPLDLAL